MKVLVCPTEKKALVLTCPNCKAAVPDTPKYRGRFLRRHPKLCTERINFTKQLAEGVRSVED